MRCWIGADPRFDCINSIQIITAGTRQPNLEPITVMPLRISDQVQSLYPPCIRNISSIPKIPSIKPTLLFPSVKPLKGENGEVARRRELSPFSRAHIPFSQPTCGFHFFFSFPFVLFLARFIFFRQMREGGDRGQRGRGKVWLDAKVGGGLSGQRGVSPA